MIQLSAAGKRFGPKLLFENLDWLVTPDERVGLVGANGTGKSTLLKVLAGLEALDYGSIVPAKHTTLATFRRTACSFPAAPSLTNACRFSRICARSNRRWKSSRTAWRNSITPPEYSQVADRYQVILSHFRAHDGYAIDAQVGTVLDGLGFRKEDWTRHTEEFSGGWQMRIALAKLLLRSPTCCCSTSPPTISISKPATGWNSICSISVRLRAHLARSLLPRCHRRRIAEIWNKRVHFYSGNYEKYLAQKKERRDSLDAAYKNQRDRIEQLEAFINRFRYQATKAKQVQSRIKELEKIERIEIPPDEKTIHFPFPQPKPSGRLVAEVTDVAKSYGAKEVFREVNFTIERGDRIALVGVNGAGKSTLIKLLAGVEPLTEGKLNLGHNVEPDYFAQDQYKELDPPAACSTISPTSRRRSPLPSLRSMLGCFLFSEDDVFKPIGVLSGGERNRYALARMLMHPSNFLLLDEPTNHLDMRAKDVLLESLQKYNGTVVFVSHDRYFIDKLATRVFEVGDGRVEVFPGNYEDYLWRKQREQSGEGEAEQAAWTPTLSDVPGYAEQKSQAEETHQSHQAEAVARPATARSSRTLRNWKTASPNASVSCNRSSARKKPRSGPSCWPSAAANSKRLMGEWESLRKNWSRLTPSAVVGYQRPANDVI